MLFRCCCCLLLRCYVDVVALVITVVLFLFEFALDIFLHFSLLHCCASSIVLLAAARQQYHGILKWNLL